MGFVGVGVGILVWMEIWDYVGGCLFRVFFVENVVVGEEDGVEFRILFVFFDCDVVSRDLKKVYVDFLLIFLLCCFRFVDMK